MKFKGKLLTMTEKEYIGQNGTEKQCIILEEVTDSQYKDSLCIEFFWDKVSALDKMEVGDLVEVDFNPRCKEYNGRWYNSISGWKFKVLEKGTPEVDDTDDNDDLPF